MTWELDHAMRIAICRELFVQHTVLLDAIYKANVPDWVYSYERADQWPIPPKVDVAGLAWQVDGANPSPAFMTKKHYRAFAELVKTLPIPYPEVRRELAERLMVILAAENPQFNRTMFITAGDSPIERTVIDA